MPPKKHKINPNTEEEPVGTKKLKLSAPTEATQKQPNYSKYFKSDQMPLVPLTKTLEPLGKEFYAIEVVELAKALLGKILVRQTDNGYIQAIIVETEAYKAPLDKACHAYNNKKTERTKYFWQKGGHAYMYSIYGDNWCFNITAGKETEPEAVLLRAVEPLKGVEVICQNRSLKNFKAKELTAGPAKLTKALSIDKSFNSHDLTQTGKLFLIDNPDLKFEVEATKRINIDYAEEWKDKLWRFVIKGNKYVSV